MATGRAVGGPLLPACLPSSEHWPVDAAVAVVHAAVADPVSDGEPVAAVDFRHEKKLLPAAAGDRYPDVPVAAGVDSQLGPADEPDAAVDGEPRHEYEPRATPDGTSGHMDLYQEAISQENRMEDKLLTIKILLLLHGCWIMTHTRMGERLTRMMRRCVILLRLILVPSRSHHLV